MTTNKTNSDHAKRVALILKGKPSPVASEATGVWHWVNGVASGIGHFLGKVVGGAIKIISLNIHFDGRVFHDIASAYIKFWTWIWTFELRPLFQRINAQLAALAARERHDFTYLIRLIQVVAQTVMAYAATLVNREAAQRRKAIKHAEALARQEVRHLHQTIEREAVSGYAVEQSGRTDLIVKLLEFAGARNPVVRVAAGDIATGLIDLLSVEDPPLRILLGFIIKHVIERLGVERPLGHLIDDLMAPILGDPKPHDLHDVIADISKRLSAAEGQWAQFFTDGGSEVEQAGREWQGITSLATSAAVVAFTATAVIDPDGWARELQSVIGTPAADLVAAATALFRG